MSLIVNLRKRIHRKQWEPIFTPLPAATGAGMCLVRDDFNLGDGNQAYFIQAVATIYAYAPNEEGFMQIPTSASAGTFGAGAAGYVHPVGPNGTASAGSTTTLTTTLTLVRDLRGYRIRITGGSQAGQERIIASNTTGANAVITLQDALPGAADNTSVYTIFSGRLWFYVPGATSGFNYYDFALNTWTSRSVVSGPAITTNEGILRGTPSLKCVTDYATASSASSTTLVDSTRNWLVNKWAYTLLKIISGTGAGQYRIVTSNTATTLTVSTAWSTTPDSTSVYEVGSLACGIASAGASTTLTVTTGGPAYALNMWATQQIRIVAGTGVGQVRTVASHTAGATSVITVSSAWTANPDATSIFVIEGNDDAMYFMGGAAVTLFKYSISGNTWSTLSPTAARAAVVGPGAGGFYLADVDDPSWMAQTGPANATTYRQNGRYIYSFRGNAGAVLDIYDIAANTWISGVSYPGGTETFTTGTTWGESDGYIYCQKDATGRFFRYDATKNEMVALGTNSVVQGAAISGDRMLIDKYIDPTNGKFVRFIYWAVNTSNSLWRLLEI